MGNRKRKCVYLLMDKFGGSLSRGSIAGKISRLNLPTHAPYVAAKAPKKVRRRHKPRALKFTPEGFTAVGGIEHEIEPLCDLSPDDIPIHQRKQLLDLESHHCRWPYGDPGTPGFFFCGATSNPDHPYCSMHCGIAYAGFGPARRPFIPLRNEGRAAA